MKIKYVKKNLYMNFHLKIGLEVEFTVYEGEMMNEGALTLSTLCYMANIAVCA